MFNYSEFACYNIQIKLYTDFNEMTVIKSKTKYTIKVSYFRNKLYVYLLYSSFTNI